MAKNKINDLRDHLFEVLEALKDTENPMDLARAQTISDVAQTIINSAKVEVELIKAVSGSASGHSFFNVPEEGRLPAGKSRGLADEDIGPRAVRCG